MHPSSDVSTIPFHLFPPFSSPTPLTLKNVYYPTHQLSFPLEQFQHLPNPYYPHDALRDSLVRTNIVNLDLASPPPPQRTNPRSHPLTPPDTPGVRRSTTIHVHDDEDDEKNNETSGGDMGLKRSTLDSFLSLGLIVNQKRNPTRYLVVGGVPPGAPTTMLSQVFCVSRLFPSKNLSFS